MENRTGSRQRHDGSIALVVFAVSFALYAKTLAPSVVSVFDDTLEIQYVVPRLGILHQTGYPLYTLLGKLFTLLVPIGDQAFRLNLFSALSGGIAVAALYRTIGCLVRYRAAAIIGALIFAASPTFWQQATRAEVYTLQMLFVALVLYLTLALDPRSRLHIARLTFNALDLLALILGLGLAHHRLIVLIYPAVALYLLLTHKLAIEDWRLLARAAFFFFLPLAAYLYLPWRGSVGSADGTYLNTLEGFLAWTMATQYVVFLTGNPFSLAHRARDYWRMFRSQLTDAGVLLALFGGISLLSDRVKEFILLTAALAPVALFAFSYHVPDVEVHFLTVFALFSVFAGIGVDRFFTVISNLQSPAIRFVSRVSATGLLLVIPGFLLLANYSANDLADKWDVHDCGLDILRQPLERNATVIGILGEMTRLRYFQENRGIRPDVQTIAADKDAERLHAIDEAVKQNRTVYTTRPLKGLPDRYSLSSLGTLVRVLPEPNRTVPPIQHILDDRFGAVQLIGYNIDASRLAANEGFWHAGNSRMLRVTLFWRVDGEPGGDAVVSVKVLRADQRILGQVDLRPVQQAYPTAFWRKGEVITDTYDVPIFLGIMPGTHAIQVTMYDSQSGAIIAQKTISSIAFAGDMHAPRPEFWNISRKLCVDFGALSLEGYTLATDETITLRAGDALPLTLLWRLRQDRLPDGLNVRVWLDDAVGKTIALGDAPLSAGFPPFRWQPGMFVRDWPLILIPPGLADGRYTVKLSVARRSDLLGPALKLGETIHLRVAETGLVS